MLAHSRNALLPITREALRYCINLLVSFNEFEGLLHRSLEVGTTMA